MNYSVMCITLCYQNNNENILHPQHADKYVVIDNLSEASREFREIQNMYGVSKKIESFRILHLLQHITIPIFNVSRG